MKINELIKELCPNGVEWKTIGEVTYISDYVAAGSFASLRDNVTYQKEPDYAVLLRVADFSSNFDESKFIYISESAYNFLSKSNLQPGDIIMSNVGSCGLTFRCPNLGKKMSLAPNAIVIRTSNNSFYYHWFTSKQGQNDIQRITSKSAMPKFNKTQFKQLRIPIPPLAIQTRIVEILDHFTNITANLNAELNLRRKQYEHYREIMLMFGDDVEWKKIGDVTYISDYVSAGSFASLRENVTYQNEPDFAILLRVADFSSNFDESKFIYISESAYNFLSKSNLQPGDIIMSNVGSCGLTFRCPNLGKKMSLAPNAIVIRTPNNSFYYHWFTSKQGQNDIQRITSKSAMPKFNKTQFKQLRIPIPPLAIQTRIVEILDKFTALIANIKQEIALRQKQYEYYREQLLSFERSTC